MRKKRILWICNHVTLMDAEVPLLLELGFEVFVPKKFPVGIDFISCKSKYDYDVSLTIPPEDLALLNTVDFYEDVFSQEVIDAVNRNFDIAITAFYERPMKLLVRHFPGQIFIRAFGLAGEASYWAVALDTWGRHFTDQMSAIRDRLFFAMSYRNMLKVEKNIFRDNAVFLPLGLPESFGTRLRDGYTGTKRQILFVCPKICAVDYYYKAYKKFKSNFKGFPYVIAGKPFGKIADRHLLGYLPREEFDRVFCESRVMYYHSTEPRHLHYHPLEAIYANQPLIFMSDGMLGQLNPKIKYPGSADTIIEARMKVMRVLANDRRFIRDIQTSQKDILNYFTPEYVKKFWKSNFLPLVADAEKKEFSPVVPVEREHVGVILPLGYRGGTLHAFIQIAKMLRKCGYRVTIGLPYDYYDADGEYYYPAILDDVERKLGPDSGIHVRFFKWRTPEPHETRAIREMGHLSSDVRMKNKYAVMDDSVNCFCECDRWLFVSDRFHKGMPVPLRPYTVIVYDYLQRYMPFQLLPEKLENLYLDSVSHADSLFVTNQETASDMIVHSGVKRKKIFLMPFEFSAQEMAKYSSYDRPPHRNKRPYIVWACNCAWHKNHVRVLNALIRYYREEFGSLEVFITGVETKQLDYKKNREKEKNESDEEKKGLVGGLLEKLFRKMDEDKENNNPYDDKKDGRKKKKAPKVTPRHILEFRELYKKNKDLLKNNVHIMGEMDRYSYFDLVAGAEFLLLSSISDNGAFGAIEAAWLGTPCASSDYPHMRYMAGKFGIEPLWYKGEKIDSIVDALNRMQRCSGEYREHIPDRERLRSMSYELQQETIQKTLREAWS